MDARSRPPARRASPDCCAGTPGFEPSVPADRRVFQRLPWHAVCVSIGGAPLPDSGGGCSSANVRVPVRIDPALEPGHLTIEVPPGQVCLAPAGPRRRHAPGRRVRRGHGSAGRLSLGPGAVNAPGRPASACQRTTPPDSRRNLHQARTRTRRRTWACKTTHAASSGRLGDPLRHGDSRAESCTDSPERQCDQA